jgi:hypothetical protein
VLGVWVLTDLGALILDNKVVMRGALCWEKQALISANLVSAGRCLHMDLGFLNLV